jgi:circadian clock protein KaiC
MSSNDLTPEVQRRMREVYNKGPNPRAGQGPRAPSGIWGFDEITGGGLPAGHSILILGEPGAGKTILASQFLAHGLFSCNENGLYVSLKESRELYYDEMRNFGWDFVTAEREGKFMFIDASPDVDAAKTLTIASPDFTLAKLLSAVRSAAATVGAKRIVIDKLTMLGFHFLNEQDRRKGILETYLTLQGTHATSLLLTDILNIGLRGRAVLPEECLYHGTILMKTTPVGKMMERVIQIEKLLRTQIDRQPRPYKITDRGIEVFPRETII